MKLDFWVKMFLCGAGMVHACSRGMASIQTYQDEKGNWVLVSRPNPSAIRRSVPSEPSQWFPIKALPFRDEIDKNAKQWDLPISLVLAVIEVESNFNPKVVSRKGAKGLMQLMDETAKDMGVRNVFDPRENIWGGCKYLRYLIDRFDGKTDLVLAGYNAGPGTVERYRGIPPFKETIHYVRSVKEKHEGYSKLLDESSYRMAKVQPQVQPQPERRARAPLRAFVDEHGVIHLTSGR